MNKTLLVVSVLALLFSCKGMIPDANGEPEPPPVLPLKFVAIGDDFTMGIQSAGLRVDFQMHSYPKLVSLQAAAAGLANVFEQPDISAPGIGMPPYLEPLTLDSENQITYTLLDEGDDLLAILLPLLANAYPQRPYNNLGITGAKLLDLSSTTSFSNSVPEGNFFFDIVLRNLVIPGYTIPNFGGRTVIEQVSLLDERAPTDTTVIMVWIGINDVVGAAISGGEIITRMDFETQYRALLTALEAGFSADKEYYIILGNLPSYVPFFYALDDIFVGGGGGEPVMFKIFDTLETYEVDDLHPVEFDEAGETFYVPLLVEETDAVHLLLTGGFAYWLDGVGIPCADDLNSKYDLGAATIDAIIDGKSSVGTEIPASQTLTTTEKAAIIAAIDACNAVIAKLADEYDYPLVDIHAIMDPGGFKPFGGYSGAGDYYLLAPDNVSFFSLDGLHPSNLGYAVIANAFIEAINSADIFGDTEIPLLNLASFTGQYATGN